MMIIVNDLMNGVMNGYLLLRISAFAIFYWLMAIFA